MTARRLLVIFAAATAIYPAWCRSSADVQGDQGRTREWGRDGVGERGRGCLKE